jgi:putative two-component system response regulator
VRSTVRKKRVTSGAPLTLYMTEGWTKPPSAPVSRRPRVLVADENEPSRSYLVRLLSGAGYVVDVATEGPSALSIIASGSADVVLLDANLPGLSGFEVCRRVKQEVQTRLTPIVVITAGDSPSERVEGLDAGADDFLTKPVDRLELLARVKSLVRMKQFTDDLDSASAIITTLAAMIESRDRYGTGHCYRMANYATALGRALMISESDVQALYRGGFLHDIGMLAIPDSLLRKEGPLNPEEYDLVKSHTVIGDGLCANLRSLQPIRPIVRSHHERLDGSGYPDGLKGDAIPLVAQIVGVVDVFEAITTPRPYQKPLTSEEAVDVLRDHAHRGWLRVDIVDAFATLIEARTSTP